MPEPPPEAATPLIRPEIPGYAIAPAIAQQLGLAAIDRFHARQGDEFLLNSYGTVPGGWGRLFGRSADMAWSPRIAGLDFQLAPRFDGHVWGLQAGLDLMGWDNADGSKDRIGLFYTHTEASGDTIGNTLARLRNSSGKLDLRGDSLGAYWTHVAATGSYLDAVAMVTRLDGDARSHRGIGANMSGTAVLASLEGGHPFALGHGWTLEPQAQIIWQHIRLNDTRDPFSSIDYKPFDVVTGRLGVRLEGNVTLNGMAVQPFVDVNLWHTFSSSYTVTFNDRPLTTGLEHVSRSRRRPLCATCGQRQHLWGRAVHDGSVRL